MNGQQKFCTRCGRPVREGHLFCGFCGAHLEYSPKIETPRDPYAQNAKTTYTDPQGTTVAPRQPRRKTYTAQKFIAMGFGIGDIVVAFTLAIIGVIYKFAYNEYYYMRLSSYYKPFLVDLYETAILMFFFAAIVFIGAIIAWSFFFVYSKKRREVMAEIALEKQQSQAQANTWNQM